MEIIFDPIGIIHSPFKDIAGMPIQPSGAQGIRGFIEIYPQFTEGLLDLEGFSHIYLLYHFHKVQSAQLMVTPFLDDQPHGVFATRAPRRPNPIGLSVVRLVNRQEDILHVENLDILDGTPLLDIKPYLPQFDHFPADRFGWLQGSENAVRDRRSDDRFR